MRITVIAVGTRGDVEPTIALAQGLRRTGHEVRFATEATHARAVASAGLEYYGLSGNSEAFNSGRGGKLFRESVERPTTRYVPFWKNYVAPVARVHLREAVAPCEGADVLVCQPWFGLGPSLSEKFRIPAVVTCIFPVPELPAREFPFPLYSQARADLTEAENLRTWRRSIPFMRVGHDTIQQWRVAVLGLREQTFREHLEQTRRTPHLLGYSPLVVPAASEWGDDVEVTGYWFLDRATGYRPPPELEKFLSEGEPPVVVGFGSQVSRNPREFTKLILDALALAGRRGILISGWGGLKTEGLPSGVYGAPSLPYDWLFQRASLVVHHGGAGSTGLAFNTGLPQLVIPFGWDQAFWGYRTAALGVALQPLDSKTLTAEQLAASIRLTTRDESIRRRAAELGELIREERGVEAGAAAVERFARQHGDTGTQL